MMHQCTPEQWDELIGAISEAKEARATEMPTEADALAVMFRAWERLKELGWRAAMYAPVGKEAEFIEAGSTGIHHGHTEERETGGKSYWLHDPQGDMWPATPILFRLPA